jgi:hypothetical protein
VYSGCMTVWQVSPQKATVSISSTAKSEAAPMITVFTA